MISFVDCVQVYPCVGYFWSYWPISREHILSINFVIKTCDFNFITAICL